MNSTKSICFGIYKNHPSIESFYGEANMYRDYMAYLLCAKARVSKVVSIPSFVYEINSRVS